MNSEVTMYIVFAYGLGTAMIGFVFPDDLRNPDFYRKYLIAAVISSIVGLAFEFTKTFNLTEGITLVVMSIALLHLATFRLLSKLFKNLTGHDPCVTSASSSDGHPPLGGFRYKYPKNRKIELSDFAFSFLQALIPIFTVIVMIYFIKN
ncbi:MAG: hypothetical protein ACQETL_14425 [Bacteroidota bacterium]